MSADEVNPYRPADGADFFLACDVPDGYEVRCCAYDEFVTDRQWSSDAIVEARPVPVPPVTVEIPRDLAEGFVNVANAFVPGGNIGKVAALIREAL